eukprot:CAMPEP_0172377084 /NCGR_PEP_ID=MMETSP1060-20121228/68720_1 /TAXON_ID=37318 /ORGANISM="Pseudo-nitzschia pungens, Strain cf. cingulata" /LENGTH=451 /DNA_ID=CAMNT_0013104755 /DNA_START=142 /DNA_END=1497 /DNA_ORIENTATION=+
MKSTRRRQLIANGLFGLVALSSLISLLYLAITGEKESKSLQQQLTNSTDVPSSAPSPRLKTTEPTNEPTWSPTTASTLRKPTLSPTVNRENATTTPSGTPSDSPTPSPSNNDDNKMVCGCATCDKSVWNTVVDDHSCGSRIEWLMQIEGLDERDACSIVAGSDFPVECGGCDPARCVDNSSPKHKCGAAVDFSSDPQQGCQSNLWDPTGDATMHCFASGGSWWENGNPCHLSNNSDRIDGRFNDPSACLGDTFYLWQEPDRNGRSYHWAGQAWLEYTIRFRDELLELKANGTKITSPTLKAGTSGEMIESLKDFYESCGFACFDENDPAHVDVIAIDAMCGDVDDVLGCRDEAALLYNAIEELSEAFGNLPVYITSWSRLPTSDAWNQLEAIYAIDNFFDSSDASNPVIERVYWSGTTNSDSVTGNSALTEVLVDGSTLGEHWRKKCDTLN